MKLSKIFKPFSVNHLIKEKTRKARDYQILNANLPRFFPGQESIAIFMKILRSSKNQDKKNHIADNQITQDIYSVIYLALNTRNEEWLLNYINNSLNLSPDGFHVNNVKLKNIKTFIQTNPAFIYERNRFEQDIVADEIKYLMEKFRINQYTNSNLYRNKITNSVNAHEDFRQEVVNNTMAYGLGAFSIEAGLENNFDSWLKPTLAITFDNKIINPFTKFKNKISDELYLQIYNQTMAHRDDYLALAEFEHYEKYKDVIDDLGVANYHMKMKPDEAMEKYLAWNEIYQQTLDPTITLENLSQNHEPINEK